MTKASKVFQTTLYALGAILVMILMTVEIAHATKYTPPEPETQEQHQAQDQSQNQSQGQNQSSEASAAASASAASSADNSGVNNSTKVYAAGASSGDSSSTCQKVRDIRLADGFLFGLRWDMTDKDCRRLDVADQAYARGDTYFGDTLTCTVPFVLEAFESVHACKSALERNDVVEAIKAENQRLREDRERLMIERQYDRDEVEACRSDLDKLDENCTK